MSVDIENNYFMYRSALQVCYSFIHTKSGDVLKLNRVVWRRACVCIGV